MTKNKIAQLGVLSILHFLVDFICISWLIFWVACVSENIITFGLVIKYNCMAFLTQPLIGNYIDKLVTKHSKSILRSALLVSAVFILVGFVMVGCLNCEKSDPGFPILFIGITMLALGNSLFHVIGGKITLSMSKKATVGGIFVSTGALGVALGTALINLIYHDITVFYSISPFLYAALCIVMCYLITKDKDEVVTETNKESSSSYGKELVITLLVLCLAIVVRSFLGSFVDLGRRGEGLNEKETLIIYGLFTLMGKALGGFLYDRFGPIALVSFSTVVSTLVSIFLPGFGLALVFVLSFNLLMPLTLHEIRKYYPNQEGFAFGLTAGLLIPGYLFGLYMKEFELNGSQNTIAPLICLITGAGLLAIYLYRRFKKA